MDESRWNAVDEYVNGLLVQEDDALAAAVRTSEAAGLPAIAVTPAHGKLLLPAGPRAEGDAHSRDRDARRLQHDLARPRRSRRPWVVNDRSRPETRRRRPGQLLARVSAVIELRVAPALDTLSHLAVDAASNFDFVFIDADKSNHGCLLRMGRPPCRPPLIVVDNVVRERGAWPTRTATTRACVRCDDSVRSSPPMPRVTATVIQTVGAKGYDGVLIALIK